MSQLGTPSGQRLVGTAAVWGAAAWALALGSFGVAMVSSYRQVHFHIRNDLRSPAILLVNAVLATAVALGFSVCAGRLTRWRDAHICLRFGVWSAAVFRLVPPFLNEDVLFLRNCGTFDAPYVLLGACIHAGLAALLACPYAHWGLNHSAWTDGEDLWEMCGAVILVFLIVACVVRLLSESWWLA